MSNFENNGGCGFAGVFLLCLLGVLTMAGSGLNGIGYQAYIYGGILFLIAYIVYKKSKD
jgi:hypothetical protein